MIYINEGTNRTRMFISYPYDFQKASMIQGPDLARFVCCLFVITPPLPRDGGTACRQPN